MNPRRKISFAHVLVWTILGFSGTSNARPSDENDSGLTGLPMSRSISKDSKEVASSKHPSVAADDKTVNSAASMVVPQIGYLEERSDVSNIGKDPLPIVVASPTGSDSGASQGVEGAGNGILVPVVSVVDTDSSTSNNGIVNHPLVALLPAPADVGQDSKMPEIASLPVIQAEPAKPEIRRSLEVESRPNNKEDDKSSEMLDVAEDIVFRPLFAMRQATGKSSYTSRNYRPSYRRYNVNGYYRIPNNAYYRSSNYNSRGSDADSDEYGRRSV